MKRVKEARRATTALGQQLRKHFLPCRLGSDSCSVMYHCQLAKKVGEARYFYIFIFAFLAAKPDVRGFLEERKKKTRGRIKINLRMAE